jgi:FAD:protein FMN transferase
VNEPEPEKKMSLRKFFKHRDMSYLFFILFTLTCMSCNPSHAPTRFEGVAMTIAYCVQIGDRLSDPEIATIEEIIRSTFSHIHQTYDNWNPDSEISKLNHLPANLQVALSLELASFLESVGEIVAQTEGRFDPTVEPLQQLWKKSLQQGALPSADSLAELTGAIGWDKIHVENGLFWKEHPLTRIDLGGIAKGYAVDLLAEQLAKAGYTQIYVEWGGEIRTLGLHPNHRPWKIGIRGLSSIDLTDAAIATSGSYIQNWSVGEVNYTHIIDPRTQEPLQNSPISSVSVIAPTCKEADAIATALMLFPSQETAKRWAKEKNFQVFIW